MTQKPVAEMTFEDALGELERVVSQLEGSQVALEESIQLYERGEILKKHCEIRLKSAEEKVAQITLGRDGQPDGLKPVKGL
ncbi:MAG: exodeoxyribonuclease VII small subunit [Alphaproteobacteria bacterium]|nr:exodeoxyribonuclease VII small subunit [Alphaproteobacteria bacterium]